MNESHDIVKPKKEISEEAKAVRSANFAKARQVRIDNLKRKKMEALNKQTEKEDKKRTLVYEDSDSDSDSDDDEVIYIKPTKKTKQTPTSKKSTDNNSGVYDEINQLKQMIQQMSMKKNKPTKKKVVQIYQQPAQAIVKDTTQDNLGYKILNL